MNANLNTQAETLLSTVTGGANPRRIALLSRILAAHPDATVEECCDEKSGKRYGDAAIRRGQCEKIGGGGRNAGSRYSYQIWAVWPA